MRTTFFAVIDQIVLKEVVYNTLTENLNTINIEFAIVEIILGSYRIAVFCIYNLQGK